MDAAVARVRSFNRLVTERVGALNDRYLARDRPLGEARVLWEIGPAGCEIRQLRARLGLDSGYLSRLLRSLEAAGLVRVVRTDRDGRVRRAELTPAGVVERDLLDRRSDELARSFLDPLGAESRGRLVAAMAEVERLLTSGLVEFETLDARHPEAQACLREYASELEGRFDTGFDPTAIADTLDELRPPKGVFVIARLNDDVVGCSGLKLPAGAPAEVKRMWVAGHARGLGIGRRLLGELERRASAAGATSIRLETNEALAEAISLYRSSGFREVRPFNDEAYAHHWFEKELDRPA